MTQAEHQAGARDVGVVGSVPHQPAPVGSVDYLPSRLGTLHDGPLDDGTQVHSARQTIGACQIRARSVGCRGEVPGTRGERRPDAAGRPGRRSAVRLGPVLAVWGGFGAAAGSLRAGIGRRAELTPSVWLTRTGPVLAESDGMGIVGDVLARPRNRILLQAIGQLARAQKTVGDVQQELADGDAKLGEVAAELQKVRTALDGLKRSGTRAGWFFLALGVILGVPAGLLVSYLSHRLGM